MTVASTFGWRPQFFNVCESRNLGLLELLSDQEAELE
jgi:hypothetical protein